MREDVKNRLNKILIVVLLCAILVALLIILAKCFSAQNLETNNDSNMGMVTSGDDYVFYYKYNSGLVKIKDEKEYQIADEQCYSIQYADGYVYYTTPNGNGGIDIKKVSQNGDSGKILTSVSSELTKMYLADGYLYYTTSNPNTISKIDIDGESQSTVLTRAVVDFKVVDKKIYFIDDMEFLYEVDTNGENYKTVVEEKLARKFQILDNEIYFYDEANKKLMKYDLDKKKKSEVTDVLNCDIFNVTSRGVYYYDSDTSKICHLDLKSKKLKEITNVSITNTKINIIDNQLYYLDVNDNGSYIAKRIGTNGKAINEIKY